MQLSFFIDLEVEELCPIFQLVSIGRCAEEVQTESEFLTRGSKGGECSSDQWPLLWKAAKKKSCKLLQNAAQPFRWIDPSQDKHKATFGQNAGNDWTRKSGQGGNSKLIFDQKFLCETHLVKAKCHILVLFCKNNRDIIKVTMRETQAVLLVSTCTRNGSLQLMVERFFVGIGLLLEWV